MTIKIAYHIMPYEIDYALLAFIQLKKSKYYLDKNIKIKIDLVLNCSNLLIDWNTSKLPKEFFIQKFKDLLVFLNDFDVKHKIYEGDNCYGILDMQRESYEPDIDYYIGTTPDMYFSEHLLYYMTEAAKTIKNKYFVIVPEIHKMWDFTWDELVNKSYLDIPYDKWDSSDIFDVRNKMKMSDADVFLEKTTKPKWAWWMDLYNKAFYEELVPVQTDWAGYGPWDFYSLIITDYVKQRGVDFNQYILRGQTIFDYNSGPLKNKNLMGAYKNYISINKTAPDQRKIFESNLNLYIQRGITHLQKNGIIK